MIDADLRSSVNELNQEQDLEPVSIRRDGFKYDDGFGRVSISIFSGIGVFVEFNFLFNYFEVNSNPST